MSAPTPTWVLIDGDHLTQVYELFDGDSRFAVRTADPECVDWENIPVGALILTDSSDEFAIGLRRTQATIVSIEPSDGKLVYVICDQNCAMQEGLLELLAKIAKPA